MPPFPLLRVPFLPLKSIINNMCIIELIRLHMCSKKLHALLNATKKSVSFDSLSENQRRKLNILEKLWLLRLQIQNNSRGSSGCFPTNYVTITIIIGLGDKIMIKIKRDSSIGNRYQPCFPFYFYVEHVDNEVNGTRGRFDIDGITVPVVIRDRNDIHIFWEDQSNLLKNLVNYSKKFFNTQTIECFFYESRESKFSQNLETVVKGMTEQTISNCTIDTDVPKTHDYKLILDNVKPTILFEHNYGSKRCSDFQHEIQFRSKCLKLVPAQWFTYNNLIMTNCENIELGTSILTNDDMCEYVKLWMDGRYPKLKQLSVKLRESINLEYIFNKLQSFSQKKFKLARHIDDIIRIIEGYGRHTVAIIIEIKKRRRFSENKFEFSITQNSMPS